MAIDFKRLMDPAVQAELRARREADEAEREAKEKQIRAALDSFAATAAYDQLSAREQNFIRSCERRIRTFLPLSGPQEAWLFDLAAKFIAQSDGEDGPVL